MNITPMTQSARMASGLQGSHRSRVVTLKKLMSSMGARRFTGRESSQQKGAAGPGASARAGRRPEGRRGGGAEGRGDGGAEGRTRRTVALAGEGRATVGGHSTGRARVPTLLQKLRLTLAPMPRVAAW